MAPPLAPSADAPPDRVARLRGAGVAVDPRRIGQVAFVLLVASLLALSVGFFVAGAKKNAQIDALRSRGVTLPMRVTGCVGLMGGSGSNLAGYACRGSYRFGGLGYREQIPGDTFLEAGSTIRIVADPTDPGLISTPATLAGEQASWRVFLLPALLLAAALLLGAAGWRRGQLALRRVDERPRAAGGGV